MASCSCILVMVVIICVCEKVACIRPAGGAPQYKVTVQTGGATWKQESGHGKAEGAMTWKQESGHGKAEGAMWKQAKKGDQESKALSRWKQERSAGCSPCEEVYVVRDEGETLQTISEKCHAPFILLDNPHVQDTDDISAGSVLLISSTHLPC